MTSYGILLTLAVMVNLRDRRMLLLSLVVGAGIFMPIQDAYFYGVCMLVEVAVGISAALLQSRASKVVLRISQLLIIFHTLGWWLNGYPPESPYHLMVRICEHAELLACIILSAKLTLRSNHARYH